MEVVDGERAEAVGTSLEVHDNSDKAHGLRFEVRAQPDVGPPSD